MQSLYVGIFSLHSLVEKGANPQDMDYLSHAQREKMELALPNLKLLVWLDEKGLYNFQQILADEGYTELHSLAEMDIEAVMQLAKRIGNYDQRQNLLQALDELHKAKASDDSNSQGGILVFCVTCMLYVCDIAVHVVCHFQVYYGASLK